jgi:hypothetical protein
MSPIKSIFRQLRAAGGAMKTGAMKMGAMEIDTMQAGAGNRRHRQ